MPPVLPPNASLPLTVVFSALAVSVAAASVALVARARARLGHEPAAVRRTAAACSLACAAWIGVWLLAAESGLLARVDLRPPPVAVVVLAVIVAGVVIAFSRVGDWLASGSSMTALIGVQAFRLPLELTMHRAASEGVMPVQMSFEGWNFDIVTGALALAIWIAFRRRDLPRPVAVAFAGIGTALLIAIVAIAVVSTPLVRAFGDDPSALNTWILFPPFILLPAVLVLAAWVFHLVLFRRLRGTV